MEIENFREENKEEIDSLLLAGFSKSQAEFLIVIMRNISVGEINKVLKKLVN